ncbi:MAG: hypothetical protein HKM93_13510 [Desulfobacteraceae bacterium]|nr:hypothetical protein [Desulfobacteraceae bacterium]
MRKFFLYLFLSLVLWLTASDFIVHNLTRGLSQREKELENINHAKGFFHIIINDLQPLSSADKRAYIQRLQNHFTYPVFLENIENISIDPHLSAPFNDGKLVLNTTPAVYFQRIGDADLVVGVGPLPELEPKSVLNLIIIYLVILHLVLAMVCLLWALTFGKSLKKITGAAIAIGEGNFITRADIWSNSFLAPLANAFNGMADRIHRLISTQKKITHSISRELHTPISRIRSRMELYNSADGDTDKQRYLKAVKKDVDELEILVNQLLSFARLDSETATLNLVTVNMVTWLKTQVEAFRFEFETPPILFTYPGDEIPVLADIETKLMGHAVHSLMKTVICESAFEIGVVLVYDAHGIVIHIDNNDTSLGETDRATIAGFNTATEHRFPARYSGNALNILVARQIILRHGGELKINHAPTGGLRFTLQWPPTPVA